jgi:hypothetical protein
MHAMAASIVHLQSWIIRRSATNLILLELPGGYRCFRFTTSGLESPRRSEAHHVVFEVRRQSCSKNADEVLVHIGGDSN